MSGTKAGGAKAALTNKKKYGEDFYRNNAYKAQESWKENGRKPRGFASALLGKDDLTGPERASVYGAIGGRVSRRTKAKKDAEEQDV